VVYRQGYCHTEVFILVTLVGGIELEENTLYVFSKKVPSVDNVKTKANFNM
jgi:hypothetical protein